MSTGMATFALLVAGLLGLGGPPPDYSGHWTLSLSRSAIDQRIGGGFERGSVDIVHRDPSFSLRRVFTEGGQDRAAEYVLTTDGVEKTTKEGPVTTRSRMAWEGEVLVLSERLTAPQGEATNTVRYRLLDDGRTLEAKESFRGPRLQYDNTWVFERR